MGQHNGDQSEAFALQNRFTAYLLTALKRKKRDYMKKRAQLDDHELLTDFQREQFADHSICTVAGTAQVEDDALMQALCRLTARERYILFARVLDDCEYDELARSLNLQYNGAASAYHRIIKKLKDALREGSK